MNQSNSVVMVGKFDIRVAIEIVDLMSKHFPNQEQLGIFHLLVVTAVMTLDPENAHQMLDNAYSAAEKMKIREL